MTNWAYDCISSDAKCHYNNNNNVYLKSNIKTSSIDCTYKQIQ